MNRIPDPFLMQRNAQALRREELARIATGAAIRWQALVAHFAHAPYPRKGPTPTHS